MGSGLIPSYRICQNWGGLSPLSQYTARLHYQCTNLLSDLFRYNRKIVYRDRFRQNGNEMIYMGDIRLLWGECVIKRSFDLIQNSHIRHSMLIFYIQLRDEIIRSFYFLASFSTGQTTQWRDVDISDWRQWRTNWRRESHWRRKYEIRKMWSINISGHEDNFRLNDTTFILNPEYRRFSMSPIAERCMARYT